MDSNLLLTQLVDKFCHGWSFSRRRNSRLLTFAFGVSYLGPFAAGRGIAFAIGTAFCGSPFFTTVAQVLLRGSAGTAGICMLLASGALGIWFAGRGGRTSGVEAGPVAIYCAMTTLK